MSVQDRSPVGSGRDIGSSGATPGPVDRIRETFTETKNGFKTSEFYITLVLVAGVLIAAYASGNDDLTRSDGWRYAAAVVVAYVVSRGLAKLGTREPYREER